MNIEPRLAPGYEICGELLSFNGIFGRSCRDPSTDSRADVTLVTDLADWESMVTNIEVLETTAENVALANEWTEDFLPCPNEKVGGALTYESESTGLSLSFMVKSLQFIEDEEDPDYNIERGFTFDDHDGGNPITDSENALSVGDTDDFEDDDWSLDLLDGATVTAFGMEIRHSRDMVDETITLALLSEKEIVEIITLDTELRPEEQGGTVFLGIISDLAFDSILFDENVDTDDIAIADFRFASVIPDVSEIRAKVDLKPDKINLKSRGRYGKAYIELPEGYGVHDINLRTVVISEINGDLLTPPLRRIGPWSIGDYDRDLIPDLKVKFKRKKLIRLLKVSDKSITISGELLDGTRFSGMDKIRVKCKKCNTKKFKKIKKKFNKYRARHRN